MKNRILLITFLGAAALVTGCDRPETSNMDSLETATKQLDKARENTKAAVKDMKDYAYAQKSEFLAKMQGQLDEINRELDQLAAKVEKSSDAAKAEAEPKIQALRGQFAGLTKQLDDAKNANELTWAEVKAGFNKGYDDFKEGFQQARQWVSERIAPDRS
jgi:chromosome segregation ATPase